MFRQHKPVYLDGEPIGCAATKEQAIALAGNPPDLAISETEKAFHLRREREPANTHRLT
jgi:hypothetical protein